MKRALFQAMAIASMIMAIAVAPANAAYTRFTSAQDVPASFPSPLFGTTADFTAQWTVQSRSDGTSTISKVQMISMINNGKSVCHVETCKDWVVTASAVFYRVNGTQIGVPVTPQPQNLCYDIAVPANDKVFTFCDEAAFSLPVNAATVKFTWAVKVTSVGGAQTVWSKTKTVSIF